MTPKYITVYPRDFKATISVDFEGIVWVKDKKTKEFLYHIPPQDWLQSQCDSYLNRRQFLIRINEVYVSSEPDNKCPKRLLIKYIPPIYYKIIDRNGSEMPDHWSGRRRNYSEATKMVNELNMNGEYRPYTMVEIGGKEL